MNPSSQRTFQDLRINTVSHVLWQGHSGVLRNSFGANGANLEKNFSDVTHQNDRYAFFSLRQSRKFCLRNDFVVNQVDAKRMT
jgi:hypothetical protein